MTRVSRVVSTTTKLSDDTDRKLTASAGYDSLVHVHCSTSRGAPPPRAGTASLVLALEPRLSRSGEGCSSAAPPSSSAAGTPPPPPGLPPPRPPPRPSPVSPRPGSAPPR